MSAPVPKLYPIELAGLKHLLPGGVARVCRLGSSAQLVLIWQTVDYTVEVVRSAAGELVLINRTGEEIYEQPLDT